MILLDTHALVWLAAEPKMLSQRAQRAIAAAYDHGGIAIAAITLWELAWLAVHGRIKYQGTPDAFVEAISARVAVRPLTPKIAFVATQFPASYSADPCDRLIGATARSEGIALVTKDRNIRASSDVMTVW